MNRLRFRWLLAALLLGVTLMPLTACTPKGEALEKEDGKKARGEDEKKDGDEDTGPELVPVEVVQLERGPIEAVLRYSTNLEAEKEVQVFSQASRLVTKLLVEEGDRVRKGQLLVQLQDEEQRSALARAESQFKKAEREYDRQRNLFEKELISEQAFNDATYEVDQAKLAFDDAKRELTYTEVRAPISGTVTARLVNLGDNITVNQHLFDIVDFNSIVARVFVPEREIGRLEVGQPSRLYTESRSGAPRIGKVLRIAPVVDSRTGTVKTTVAIPSNAGLLPGMYVEVELITAVHDDALLVPKRALIFDNEQTFLFRVVEAPAAAAPAAAAPAAEAASRDDEESDGEDGSDDDAASAGPQYRAERVLIRPLLEDRSWVEPSPDTPLRAGDRVVVAGQQGLKDGVAVRLLGTATAAEIEARDSARDSEEGGGGGEAG